MKSACKTPCERETQAAARGCLVVLAIASVWSCVRYANEPGGLWVDELHSVWVTDGSLSDVLPRAAAGNQFPLWFWAGWLVRQTGAEPEFALRGMSSLAFLALWAAIPFAASAVHRSLAGAAAAFLLLVSSPAHIFYADEARPYEWLCMAGLVQTITCWSWLKCEMEKVARKRWRCTAWVAASTAFLVAIHPTGCLLVLAESVVLAILPWIWPSGSGCQLESLPWVRRIRLAMAVQIPAGVILLASLPILQTTHGRRGLWSELSSVETLVWDTLRNLLPALAAGASLLVSRSFGGRCSPLSVGLGRLAVALSITVSGIAIVLTTWGIAPLAMTRYLMAAAFLPALAAGLWIDSSSRRSGRWIAGIMALTAFFLIPSPNSGRHDPVWRTGAGLVWAHGVLTIPQRSRQEPWKPLLSQLSGVDPGVPVFLFANLIEDAQLEPGSLEAEGPDDSGNQLEDRRHYLSFPLLAGGKIDAARIHPRRTLHRPRWSESDLDRIEAAGGTSLVVRARQETVDDIGRELAGRFASRGLTLRTEKAPLPSGVLQLVNVTVVRQHPAGGKD